MKDEINGKKGTQTNDVNEPESVEVNEANTDLPPPHELVIQLIFSFGSLIESETTWANEMLRL